MDSIIALMPASVLYLDGEIPIAIVLKNVAWRDRVKNICNGFWPCRNPLK